MGISRMPAGNYHGCLVKRRDRVRRDAKPDACTPDLWRMYDWAARASRTEAGRARRQRCGVRGLGDQGLVRDRERGHDERRPDDDHRARAARHRLHRRVGRRPRRGSPRRAAERRLRDAALGRRRARGHLRRAARGERVADRLRPADVQAVATVLRPGHHGLGLLRSGRASTDVPGCIALRPPRNANHALRRAVHLHGPGGDSAAPASGARDLAGQAARHVPRRDRPAHPPVL